MNTKHRDEAAAICLWRHTSGEPISFGDIKAHIGSCPQCGGANPVQVRWQLQVWQANITASRRRALR
jgi:hypothetical protein